MIKRANPHHRYVDPSDHAIAHLGLNSAKVFGRKINERDLAEKMKDKFKLVKKSHRYSIASITDPMVKVST